MSVNAFIFVQRSYDLFYPYEIVNIQVKRPIHKEIFQLAVPNILSNVSVPLIGSVDTLLMGHISELHLGAVGLGGIIFSFLYWNMGFLRMSTIGLTAQAYGKEDQTEQGAILAKAILVALLASLLLILLAGQIDRIGQVVFAVDPSQQSLVSAYFRIRIWAAPATLSLIVLIGWYLGLQNAWFPLLITIIINLSNVLLSYLLVRVYDMSIAGVAWGTVIAQYIGLLAAIILYFIRYRSSWSHVRQGLRAQIATYREFFIINRDIILRTVILTVIFGFMYRESSRLGITVLAVNMIMFQFLNWMSYLIDGMAYASESLVGKYKGAKDQIKLDLSVRWSMIWACLMAVMIALIYAVAYNHIVAIFTDDEAVIVAAQPYWIWAVILPLCGWASYIWDGIYIGLVASRAMFICMLVAGIVFFASYVLAFAKMPAEAIWIALSVFLVARAVAQWIYYRKYGLGTV